MSLVVSYYTESPPQLGRDEVFWKPLPGLTPQLMMGGTFYRCVQVDSHGHLTVAYQSPFH